MKNTKTAASAKKSVLTKSIDLLSDFELLSAGTRGNRFHQKIGPITSKWQGNFLVKRFAWDSERLFKFIRPHNNYSFDFSYF